MGSSFLKLLLTGLLFIFFLPFWAISSDLGGIGIIFVIVLSAIFIILGIKLQNSIDDSLSSKVNPRKNDIPSKDQSIVVHPTPSPILASDPTRSIQSSKTLSLSTQFELVSPTSLFKYIWACSDNFDYRLNLNWILHQQTYYCAACFYVAVKSIRNQQIVDNVYSNFQKDTNEYFSTRLRGLDPYIVIVNSYKKFAPILNESSIDPRTIDGLSELWFLLQQWINIPADKLASAESFFFTDCSSVIEYSKRITLAASLNHNIGTPDSNYYSLISKIGIPEDVYFIDDYIPVRGVVSKEKPYGDFTVYVSEHGSKYHTLCNCVNAPLSSKHIYETRFGYTPCSRCAKYTRNIAPDWYRKVKSLAQDKPYYK